jgi:hypothetical protein
VKKKKKITDLFSVPELTRSFNKDLLFESPKKNQVIFEKTSSFSSQKLDEAQQTEINGEVEEELRKRFEELRNETLKM